MRKIKAFINYLLNPRTQLNTPADLLNTENKAEQKASRFQMNPSLFIGSIIMIGLAILFFLGPFWAVENPSLNPIHHLESWYDAESGTLIKLPLHPTPQQPFGTDERGNDNLSKLLHGARITLMAAALVSFGRLFLGVALGSLAGWNKDTWLDRAIMQLITIVTAIPMLISGMLLIYALGVEKGLISFAIALSVVGWTEIAQLVRGEFFVIRQQLFIEAARGTGLKEWQIVVRHIWPNIFPQLFVVSFLEMGAVLLLIAELGFLGVFIGGGNRVPEGINPVPVAFPDVPEWGLMLSEGRKYLRSNPFVIIGPAVAFFISIIGFNSMGEGLRQLFDKSAVDTSFLLRKRFLASVALFTLAAYLLISFTGPPFWYARTALDLDGRFVQQRATEIGQIGVNPDPSNGTTAYLAEQFAELELDPGWKPAIFDKSYTYTDDPETTHVMGLWPGYDFDYANELIVYFVTYDPNAEASAESATDLAIMLETIRHLKAKDVNPRRSILFVAWQADRANPAEIEAFFGKKRNFRYLVHFGTPLAPTLFLQVNGRSGNKAIQLHPDTPPQLADLIQYSADKTHAPITSNTSQKADPPLADFPWASITWYDDTPESDLVEPVSQLVALTLITLVRDIDAWTPPETFVASDVPPSSTPPPATPPNLDTNETQEVPEEEGALQAIGLVKVQHPDPGTSYFPGERMEYRAQITGAPGAYSEGADYTGVRVRLELRREGEDKVLQRERGSISQYGDAYFFISWPATLESGNYTVTLKPVSTSFHGHDLELTGELVLPIIIEEK